MAALKAVHVSDVPNLDQVPENALYSTRFAKAGEVGRSVWKPAKFLVIGHRGNGMNILQSTDPRMKAIKENSIVSFNAAAEFPVDFVEFDVQVTSDGIPVIFHDNFILTEENDMLRERRVTELSLLEFMDYGLQKDAGKVGKSLLRKLKDGRIMNWKVETDDSLCTLEDAFRHVNSKVGFNIELKFDDNIVYQEEHLVWILQSILGAVFDHAGDRPIVFSSFQPDAALHVRKLQSTFPVFFLTNGGTEIYQDVRRNSLEEAIRLCVEGGLAGIVSAVKAIFKNPGTINKIKESKLSLMTYGQLNNVPEAVYIQHLMGVDGVIVDLVEQITDAVSKWMRPVSKGTELDGRGGGGGGGAEEEKVEVELVKKESRPQFSHRELSFLLKLIPELIRHQ